MLCGAGLAALEAAVPASAIGRAQPFETGNRHETRLTDHTRSPGRRLSQVAHVDEQAHPATLQKQLRIKTGDARLSCS
jgi:hypothetical protein